MKSHLAPAFDKLIRTTIPFSRNRSARRRLRILYFITRYPTFSETYMHEEIRSLRQDYDIEIITFNGCDEPRQSPYPYEVIEYRHACLVYGSIDQIEPRFCHPEQLKFLEEIDAVIKRFKPDVLHAHYLGIGLLLRQLAEKHHIPFTIRTHSMDVLSEPPEKLEALSKAVSSRWCLRVLAFPGNTIRLINSGLRAEKVVSCWPVVNFARFYKPDRREPTGRVLCAGPAIKKKAHKDFVDLAAQLQDRGLTFDLYAKGPELENTRVYNETMGNVVNISYVDPDEMPEVYPRYDWLVYTSDTGINKVGFPVAIAEAQASGIGVCWQELPGRRAEQLEFLHGGGFLFRSIDELAPILTQPFPEEMRVRGLEAAKRCDIDGHKALLTDVWDRAAPASQIPSLDEVWRTLQFLKMQAMPNR